MTGVGESDGVKKRLAPEDRREQLIALGLDMLSRQPAYSVAVEDIAEAAGISRGLLFHYFPTKREYHLAVVRAAAQQLLDVTNLPEDLPPLDRLRSGLEAFAAFVSDHHRLYVALVRGAAGADEELQVVFEASRVEFARRVMDALAMLAGGEPSRSVQVAVRGWVGFVEESTLEWVRHGGLTRDELVSIQQRVLLAAVKASEPERYLANR